MTSRIAIWLFGGLWTLVAVIVVGYPLCTGKIRVGLDPVSRNTAPNSFWAAYIISTVLFIAVSAAVAFFVRAILTPLAR